MRPLLFLPIFCTITWAFCTYDEDCTAPLICSESICCECHVASCKSCNSTNGACIYEFTNTTCATECSNAAIQTLGCDEMGDCSILIVSQACPGGFSCMSGSICRTECSSNYHCADEYICDTSLYECEACQDMGTCMCPIYTSSTRCEQCAAGYGGDWPNCFPCEAAGCGYCAFDPSNCLICDDSTLHGDIDGNCSEPCSTTCYNNECLFTSECMGCIPSYWGPHCEYRCPSRCMSSVCSATTGSCILGCIGPFWGSHCHVYCSTCAVCAQYTGQCTLCHGFEVWGPYCQFDCPPGCKYQECFINGSCIHGCEDEYWGIECGNSCLHCATCYQDSGLCIGGGCASGRWNPPMCNMICSSACLGSLCNQTTGDCFYCSALDRCGAQCSLMRDGCGVCDGDGRSCCSNHGHFEYNAELLEYQCKCDPQWSGEKCNITSYGCDGQPITAWGAMAVYDLCGVCGGPLVNSVRDLSRQNHEQLSVLHTIVGQGIVLRDIVCAGPNHVAVVGHHSGEELVTPSSVPGLRWSGLAGVMQSWISMHSLRTGQLLWRFVGWEMDILEPRGYTWAHVHALHNSLSLGNMAQDLVVVGLVQTNSTDAQWGHVQMARLDSREQGALVWAWEDSSNVLVSVLASCVDQNNVWVTGQLRNSNESVGVQGPGAYGHVWIGKWYMKSMEWEWLFTFGMDEPESILIPVHIIVQASGLVQWSAQLVDQLWTSAVDLEQGICNTSVYSGVAVQGAEGYVSEGKYISSNTVLAVNVHFPLRVAMHPFQPQWMALSWVGQDGVVIGTPSGRTTLSGLHGFPIWHPLLTGQLAVIMQQEGRIEFTRLYHEAWPCPQGQGMYHCDGYMTHVWGACVSCPLGEASPSKDGVCQACNEIDGNACALLQVDPVEDQVISNKVGTTASSAFIVLASSVLVWVLIVATLIFVGKMKRNKKSKGGGLRKMGISTRPVRKREQLEDGWASDSDLTTLPLEMVA